MLKSQIPLQFTHFTVKVKFNSNELRPTSPLTKVENKTLLSFRLKQRSEGELIMSSHLHYFNPDAEAIHLPKEV